MPVEIYMPKMSDHMQKGKIIHWLVPEGAEVEERQPILQVETDKAIGDVESPAAGVLSGIRAREGAEVPVGEVIALVAKPGETLPSLPPIEAEKGAEAAAAPVAVAAPAAATGAGGIAAAPAARRLAREMGVDLAQVRGSGPGGRIKEEDVRAFAEQQKAEVAAPTPAEERVPASPVARKLAAERGIDLRQVKGTGPGGRITQEDVLAQAEADAPPPPATGAEAGEEDVEWLELSTIRRITGERMAASKQTVPHFGLSLDVDMTEAARAREALMERIVAESGVRLSHTALLVKVVALALRQHPLANAELAGGRIKVHKAINVGVAVGVPEGLVVPVIHHADRKSLGEIARELESFRAKAALLQFAPAELAGGTFTISNLGMFGIDHFLAIINAPQSAILAVGRMANRPVGLPDGTIALRPIMNLTLSVDHRVLDGVAGAQFLAEIKALLENPCLLLATQGLRGAQKGSVR